MPVKFQIDLRIIVITQNRSKSLHRLLNSLNEAEYESDKVALDIWIDRSKSNVVSEETLQVARGFKFQKGQTNVQIHPTHVGIKGQWLKTWTPSNMETEKAVILEDDLTVSRHFYSFLKLVHTKYKHRLDVAGFSLHGSSIRHSDGKCCLEVSAENKVFLYPVVGTWGFSPNNKNWFAFLDWYEDVLRRNITVPLPTNNIASRWYQKYLKKGKGDTMWGIEYMYYTQKNKEYILYPNFPGHRGLSFHWCEKGMHYSEKGRKTEADEAKHILKEWNLDLKDLPDNPVFLDNNGTIIHK